MAYYRKERHALRAALMAERTTIRSGILGKRFSRDEVELHMRDMQDNYEKYRKLSARLHDDMVTDNEVSRLAAMESEQDAVAELYQEVEGMAVEYITELDARRPREVDKSPVVEPEPRPSEIAVSKYEDKIAEMDQVILKMQESLQLALEQRTGLMDLRHEMLQDVATSPKQLHLDPVEDRGSSPTPPP